MDSRAIGHNLRITFLAVNTQAWTNMPAALTEIGTRFRQKSNLGALQSVSDVPIYARLQANVVTAGFAGSKLRAQASPDNGSNWFYLDGNTGPEVAIDSTGLQMSGWIQCEDTNKVDLLFRLVGVGGNGVVDPEFSSITLEFKV